MSKAVHDRPTVMISSTAIDLPRHREQAINACLRAGCFPKAMEAMAASDVDALAESRRMVDEAELYVGIFAYRYGHVPHGSTKSITHLEYERALERGIPVLAFLIHADHPVTGKDVETGPGARGLEALKVELEQRGVVAYFKSAEDLRGHIVDALQKQRSHGTAPSAASLHYVSDIPAAPEPYVAHPYTLLQTHGLIGRRKELERLTDWITHPSEFHNARILSVVAIGGMGKSALTWHWFERVVAQEMNPLAGRMWWSFYESDARFENFVIRALAYVSGRSREEVGRLPWHEREEELLRILDARPFVVVFDGLERELVAYSGMKAAWVRDDDLDDETANRVAGAIGLPASAGQSYVGRHPQRRTADPRVGLFLRKLARVRASRILASTRLYPADLQTETGQPWPGCAALFLTGLSDSDAVELWRAHGARGSREELVKLFDRFERHPLLIQALAGEVARFRSAPGDFDAWRAANSSFDPFSLPLLQVRAHVLEAAFRGLSATELKVLHVIAGFRMPASLYTLQALLVRGGEESESDQAKPFTALSELDIVLGELEDRALVGWDRRANRYDLHPIVRGVTWSALGKDGRDAVQNALQAYFEAIPGTDDDEVESIEDLTPAIELYNSLVGLKRYDEALDTLESRLFDAMFRLSANHLLADLMERLFPDGIDKLPRAGTPRQQSETLNRLALSYCLRGKPGAAISLHKRADDIDRCEGLPRTSNLSNLSYCLLHTGALHAAEASARDAVLIDRQEAVGGHEAHCLAHLSSALGARGEWVGAETAFRRSLRCFVAREDRVAEAYVTAYLAQLELWHGALEAARLHANRVRRLAPRDERMVVRCGRLEGNAALRLGDLHVAGHQLHDALARARACQLVEDELPALTALAELYRQKKSPDQARELLDDLWDLAERGPYPLFHADAFNVLASVERDTSHRDAAIDAARRAFELSWCDGPPFSYQPGLDAARRHLAVLAASEPALPPFDPSKHEPMPELELDPDDEFHAGRKPDSSGPVDDE